MMHSQKNIKICNVRIRVKLRRGGVSLLQWKAVSTTHSECVFGALIIQLTIRMLRIILSSVTCLAIPHFPTLSHRRHDFRENVIEHKMWILISSTNLFQTFLVLRVQGEHKFFPWLQKFITRKLPRYVGTVRCTSEEFQPWIIFQQDDAPPDWGSDVRRFLDETFPNRWIGRDGQTPWPPRPPDITPLDFFLWGVC